MDRNANTRELLKCVVQCDADGAIAILESDCYDHTIIEDIGYFKNPFPLSWIILCNQLLLDNEDWNRKYFDTVILPARKRNEILRSYFESNGLMKGNSIDFSLFPDERSHFENLDIDTLLDGSEYQLVEMGYNLDECRLCYSVLVGDIGEINSQIAKGTNPDVWISGDFAPDEASESDGCSTSALSACRTFYCDAFDVYDLRGLYEPSSKNADDICNYRLLSLLIEAAFYQEVENRLKAIQISSK